MTADFLPDPAPRPGLSRKDFRCVGKAGFGDGHNSYAHSMAWYKGKLYMGTTRSNMCMLKLQSAFSQLPLHVWPVECPNDRDGLYKLDFHAQIWCLDPETGHSEMVFRAPAVEGIGGAPVAREIGYRSMEVYQGPNDPEPALYIATWAPGRAPGGLILRTYDGRNFEPVTPWGMIDGQQISTTRNLTSFKGRLHFSPTARRGTDGGQQNTAGLPVIYAAADPASGEWEAVNESGWGDPANLGIFSLCVVEDTLYAGTLNLNGLQIWATDGSPGAAGGYHWRCVVRDGAGRGPLNQAVACMHGFKSALYVGTGIQGGGFDRLNNVGPAAAEVLRVNSDDTWDLIVGDRDDADREPLSGLKSGFGQFFNGYMWAMEEHDGWLYVGTYDWTVTLRWATLAEAPDRVKKVLGIIGPETVIAAEGGADLWRTADGENWLPVDRKGFGNPYNWGIRNLVTTPKGLFVGTANVFGPRVAVPAGEGWTYQDNPDGGLEVWIGSKGS